MLWDSFVRHVEIWPFLEVLGKLLLAIAVGTFVGLEGEHEGKAGVRTFALTALLGAMGGLLGGPYAVFSMVFAAVFIVLMNAREMVKNNRVAMTTSAVLAVVAFAGAMCGGGHFFTPVAACILASALLAWKQPIAGFAGMISYSEIRSAILLAVLALVIYPVLPEHAVDPWGLVEPRETGSRSSPSPPSVSQTTSSCGPMRKGDGGHGLLRRLSQQPQGDDRAGRRGRARRAKGSPRRPSAASPWPRP